MGAGLGPGTGRDALPLTRRVPLGEPFPLDSWFPPVNLGRTGQKDSEGPSESRRRRGGGSYVAPVEAGSGERSLGWEVREPAE